MIGMACIVALTLSACARSDPTLSRVEGSEPQRLSFGPPSDVQKAFTEQMKTCWFDSDAALLRGYQYDTKPAVLETSVGLTELPQVTISSGAGGPQAFVIQFYPFNENTLISTRNIALPVELAARLKRDVETWIFGQGDCQDPAGRIASPSAPQISSNAVQQASANGWSAGQEARYFSSVR